MSDIAEREIVSRMTYLSRDRLWRIVLHILEIYQQKISRMMIVVFRCQRGLEMKVDAAIKA